MAPRILFVHQFGLPRLSGLTVTMRELVDLAPEVLPGATATALSFDTVADPDHLMTVLDRDHRTTDCVVGLNLHIEAGWECSVALARWCRETQIPLLLHVHDYWPHHSEGVATLTERFGAVLLAITPAIVDDLAADGFAALLVPAGIAVSGAARTAATSCAVSGPAMVGAVGRLVPRKRFVDVVAAFGPAREGINARLHLQLPPSLVFSAEQDRVRLEEIRAEAAATGAVIIDTDPGLGTDYRGWSVYVSASEYEGVSMTPLESVMQGCPILLSDIPPHREIVATLFPGRSRDFLFGVGDRRRLAELLRHELQTAERHREMATRGDEIADIVEARWSLQTTALQLARLASEQASARAATAGRKGEAGDR